MIALVSAKGSPGVTVTALAWTLSWSGRCLLAECDPAGGDLLAGYLRGELPARRGLAELAVAELRGRLQQEFWSQLIDLDAPRRERLLLPGVTDPAQSATVASVWQPIAEHLREVEVGPDGYQVLVDCGRLTTPHVGWPLLEAAEWVLLVVRGTLPSLSAALPAIRTLRRELTGGSGGPELGLVLVDTGPYRAAEVARRLDTEVVVTLPEDPRTAARLSLGGPVPRRSPLARAAASAQYRLTRSIGPGARQEAISAT